MRNLTSTFQSARWLFVSSERGIETRVTTWGKNSERMQPSLSSLGSPNFIARVVGSALGCFTCWAPLAKLVAEYFLGQSTSKVLPRVNAHEELPSKWPCKGQGREKHCEKVNGNLYSNRLSMPLLTTSCYACRASSDSRVFQAGMISFKI